MAESRKFDYITEENMEGARMDKALSVYMEDLSRSYIQKLIGEGLVSLNGEVCSSKKIRLETGDRLSVTVPEPEELRIEAEDIPLDIVYEDDDVLVVNKPRGMVVHPAAGNMTGTLVNAVMYHCGDSLSSINGIIRPGIVHRIDKDTSGLLMVAKNDRAHRSLAGQLAEHTADREYQAIVYNNFREDQGRIDAPLGRDPRNRMKQAVTEVNSRHAVTNYWVLERFGQFTHIRARLETGRTHQIRVHMSYIKHPLLGDGLYGPQKNRFGIEGQMLHARLLGFIHPLTGEHMQFTVEPEKIFTDTLEKLRNGK